MTIAQAEGGDTDADLLRLLHEAYASVKGFDRGITPEDHLLDDLDLDSLDAFEMLLALETRLKVDLLESVADHLGQVETVGDFMAALNSALRLRD